MMELSSLLLRLSAASMGILLMIAILVIYSIYDMYLIIYPYYSVSKATQSTESREMAWSAGPEVKGSEPSDSHSDSSTGQSSYKDSNKSQQKTSEVRIVVIWCEKIEDKEYIPWGMFLPIQYL